MDDTRFWLIRHGETQWNADRRLQGWRDIPLSPIGRRQARQLELYLRSASFDARVDHIVSSDLCRAYDTACAAAAHFGLPIECNADLRERSYGIYEGRDWTSMAQAMPHIDLRDPLQAIEQGESLQAFAQRVAHAFEALAERHPGRNVLVFSHGGVIDIAWRRASGLDLTAPRPAPILNTSINRFSIGAGRQWRMLDWGRVAHLDEEALDDVG